MLDFKNPCNPAHIATLKENLAHYESIGDKQAIQLFQGLLEETERKCGIVKSALITPRCAGCTPTVRAIEPCPQCRTHLEKRITYRKFDKYILTENSNGTLSLSLPEPEPKQPPIPEPEPIWMLMLKANAKRNENMPLQSKLNPNQLLRAIEIAVAKALEPYHRRLKTIEEQANIHTPRNRSFNRTELPSRTDRGTNQERICN